MPAPHHSVFYKPDALPVAQQQRQSTEGMNASFIIYECQFHYISQILVNNRQKTSADGICFSLHVMSIFSLSAAFAVVRSIAKKR